MKKTMLGIGTFLVCATAAMLIFLWEMPGELDFKIIRDDRPPVVNDGQPLFEIKVGGKRGCMDITGKVRIEPRYDGIECSKEDMIPVEEHRLMGYVDREGNYLMRPQFEVAGDFREGLAAVKIGGKYGFINTSGEFVIRPKFDFANNFSDGFAVVSNVERFWGFRIGNLKSFFIDKTGAERFVELGASDVSSFDKGYAKVIVADVEGRIDTSGNFTAVPARNIDGEFSEGRKRISGNSNTAGYVDESGKVVIETRFGSAGDFKDGIAAVSFENGKYGYIDRDGKTVIEPQFESAGEFRDGLALVMIDRKKGYIDRSGKLVIPAIYGGMDIFRDGLAQFSYQHGNAPYEETKWGYLDKTGKVIWEPTN